MLAEIFLLKLEFLLRQGGRETCDVEPGVLRANRAARQFPGHAWTGLSGVIGLPSPAMREEDALCQ